MVTVTLDRERHLKLTLRGMIAYEEQTGNSLFTSFDWAAMSGKDRSVLIWACLLDDDHDLTYDAFIDMVDVGMNLQLMKAVPKAIMESFPDREVGKEGPLGRVRRKLRGG